MKKSINFKTGKAGLITVVLMFCTSILLISSCRKEENLPQQDPDGSTTVNRGTSVNVPEPYLFINHISNVRFVPQYSVWVFGTGMVLYEGRQYCRVIGQKQFRIPPEMMKEIEQQYINSGLINIYARQADPTTTNVNNIDVGNPLYYSPYVENAYWYKPLGQYITLRDNLRKPVDVVNLRKSVEQILGINEFVDIEK